MVKSWILLSFNMVLSISIQECNKAEKQNKMRFIYLANAFMTSNKELIPDCPSMFHNDIYKTC